MPTKIPWCDETLNFLGGCSPVSEGCLHCAAARQAQWLVNMGNEKYEGLVKNGKWTGDVRLFPDELDKPLHWRKPRMIFPCFMGDLFHEKVPFDFIYRVFDVIYRCPQHTFQILTKRIERFAETFQNPLPLNSNKIFQGLLGLNEVPWPLPNLWLGVSVENQKWADERIPILLRIPAAVRFVSLEPLLEPIDLRRLNIGMENAWQMAIGAKYGTTLDWVIIGCESLVSGRAGRFQDGFIDAAIDLVNQCKSAGVPVHIKQVPINGKVSHNPAEWPKDLRIRQWP